MRIFSCTAFRSLGEERFRIGATGGNPRRKHRPFALADEFFWSKALVAALSCEFFCALADEQRVGRVMQDVASDAAGMQKIADGSHGSRPQLGAIHDACIHFNFAKLI